MSLQGFLAGAEGNILTTSFVCFQELELKASAKPIKMAKLVRPCSSAVDN